MVKDILTRYLKMYLDIIEQLVSDLTEQQMTAQPKTEHGAVVNHPTWQIGHIVTTIWPMVEILEGKQLARQWIQWMCKQPDDDIAYPEASALPEQWMVWFDTGTAPMTGDAAAVYPKKDEVVSMLKRSHKALENWMSSASEADLAADVPIKVIREMAPTIGHTLALIVAHEAQHTGELSMWRRAMGFKPTS